MSVRVIKKRRGEGGSAEPSATSSASSPTPTSAAAPEVPQEASSTTSTSSQAIILAAIESSQEVLRAELRTTAAELRAELRSSMIEVRTELRSTNQRMGQNTEGTLRDKVAAARSTSYAKGRRVTSAQALVMWANAALGYGNESMVGQAETFVAQLRGVKSDLAALAKEQFESYVKEMDEQETAKVAAAAATSHAAEEEGKGEGEGEGEEEEGAGAGGEQGGGAAVGQASTATRRRWSLAVLDRHPWVTGGAINVSNVRLALDKIKGRPALTAFLRALADARPGERALGEGSAEFLVLLYRAYRYAGVPLPFPLHLDVEVDCSGNGHLAAQALSLDVGEIKSSSKGLRKAAQQLALRLALLACTCLGMRGRPVPGRLGELMMGVVGGDGTLAVGLTGRIILPRASRGDRDAEAPGPIEDVVFEIQWV
jgi:hypothetical protein